MESIPNYGIVIYWSNEDDAFVAEVPELLGCAADGQTYEEALEAAHEAIVMWIDVAKEVGNSVPEPKGQLTVVAA